MDVMRRGQGTVDVIRRSQGTVDIMRRGQVRGGQVLYCGFK